jgi:hypothetical protein
MAGTPRFPFRVVVLVISSTIQALPGQLALMCSGASYRSAEAFGDGPQRPEHVTTMPLLVIDCGK